MRVVDGDEVVDDGVVVLGVGPATFTGEDTVELTLHGNPLLVERVLALAQQLGARLAHPGEFTLRAVVNGKLDLVAAEGVGQLIDATTLQGARVARSALDGRLGAAVAALRTRAVVAVAELEARLDVPEDALTGLGDAALHDELVALAVDARALAATEPVGRRWVHGARVALVGAVNVGKSSLFNALLGRPRALVHASPGTTRDVVEAGLQLDGLAVTLLDTAGERSTDDEIEAAGQALARELVDDADLLVVVLHDALDSVGCALLETTAHRPRVVVHNGVDRGGAPVPGALPTVAPSGQGVPEVARAIRAALVGETSQATQLVVASARQRELLEGFASAAESAHEAWKEAGVAAASDALLQAIDAVDALTGADGRHDVLTALFARFCVGK